MELISLKLPEALLKERGRRARALGIPRAEYIRRAPERMNREVAAQARAERLAQASKKSTAKACESMLSSPVSSANRMPARGEVWLAHLNPRRGIEVGKTRPVLVVQAQALIDAGHPSTIIVPLTTTLVDGVEPLRIRVSVTASLRQDSDLLIDQIRAIDNRRLRGAPLARLDDELMRNVGRALREVLDLDERDILQGVQVHDGLLVLSRSAL